MGLLAPALLALGLAVAIPIALHLLQRQQGPRVVFPALRYLRRAERESARKVRMRQLLLLALRISAVLLLALAAARPFVRGTGAAHAPTAVVIVLDNSASTSAVAGDRRVLDELRERALETLARGTLDDAFWLIRAATPWDPAIRGDADVTAQRVGATEPAAASADLAAALARARALLQAGAEGRAAEIHLLTDLQATSLGDPLSRSAHGPALLVWSPAEPAPPNAGVAAVEIGGGLPPRSAQRSDVLATIAGGGLAEVAVRLVVDGRTVAAATATPGTDVLLPFPARAAGPVSGWVEVDPDAFRADDRRAFVIQVEPPPLVASRDPSPFVAQALAVLGDGGRLRLAAAETPEVLIAAAGVGAEAVRRGAGVIITPPVTPLELPAANGRLSVAGVPWRFEAVAAGGEWRLEAPDEPALAAALADARIRQLYTLRPAPGTADTTLVAVAGGGPWAVKGRVAEGGAYVLLATPLTAEASNIPVTPALVPLLDRLVGEVAFTPPPAAEASPGEPVPLPSTARTVARPDDVRDPVEGSGVYIVPPVTGVYRVEAEGVADFSFAVNLAARESDLRRADGAALRALLPGWTVHHVRGAGWKDAIFRERVGREVWRPLLLLALLLLLAESLIAAAGRARRRTATPEPAAAAAETY
jgi:hypothetical protein